MPVKVRCPACEKVLNAPDSARGKAVKCPGCEAKVPVPAAGATGKTGANPAVKPKKKASSSDSDSFLANLDIDASVDTESRTCPKCGADLGEDETQTECPKCGIDARTGQLSARVARKRSLKGADPNDYYKMVIPDAWKFLLGNLPLAFMSAAVTTILILIACSLGFVSFILTQAPPKMFALAFSTAFMLAVSGWYFYLTIDTVLTTLARKTELRTKFDLVTAIAYGLMFRLWMVVFLLPGFALSVFLVVQFRPDGDDSKLVGALKSLLFVYGPFLLWLPFVPPSIAHLASFSTWRGWVLPLAMKMAFKNFGQSVMWAFVFVCSMLLSVLILLGGLFLFFFFAFGIVTPLFAKAAENAAPAQIDYLKLSLTILIMLGMIYVMQFSVSCGVLLSARALGQYTYYCKEALDLVTKAEEHVYKKKDVKLDEHGRPITPLYVTIGSIVFFIVALSGAGYFVYIQLFKG